MSEELKLVHKLVEAKDSINVIAAWENYLDTQDRKSLIHKVEEIVFNK
jgi:uncharacterized protein YbaA (DUF1428 family)